MMMLVAASILIPFPFIASWSYFQRFSPKLLYLFTVCAFGGQLAFEFQWNFKADMSVQPPASGRPDNTEVSRPFESPDKNSMNGQSDNSSFGLVPSWLLSCGLLIVSAIAIYLFKDCIPQNKFQRNHHNEKEFTKLCGVLIISSFYPLSLQTSPKIEDLSYIPIIICESVLALAWIYLISKFEVKGACFILLLVEFVSFISIQLINCAILEIVAN